MLCVYLYIMKYYMFKKKKQKKEKLVLSISLIILRSLFQLLEMLKFYARFEISEETGDPLTDHDMTQLHYAKITSLQV